LRIERFAEFHNIETALTQGWAYGWGWICFACRNLQLNKANNLLCHVLLLKARLTQLGKTAVE
jgi:hypothetical protein